MQANPAYDSDRQGGNDSDTKGFLRLNGAEPFAALDPFLFADSIVGPDTRFCRFLFAYGELPVIGELRPGPSRFELRLSVVVGRLPYSVESRDQREEMLSIVRAFPTDTGASLVIAPDQSICVGTVTALPLPLTPAGLLTELVVGLFRVDPVLISLANILPDLAPALSTVSPAGTDLSRA
jgi:hypothetical protein